MKCLIIFSNIFVNEISVRSHFNFKHLMPWLNPEMIFQQQEKKSMDPI